MGSLYVEAPGAGGAEEAGAVRSMADWECGRRPEGRELLVSRLPIVGARFSFSSRFFLKDVNMSSTALSFSSLARSSFVAGVAVLLRDIDRRLVARPKGPFSTGCLRLRLALKASWSVALKIVQKFHSYSA